MWDSLPCHVTALDTWFFTLGQDCNITECVRYGYTTTCRAYLGKDSFKLWGLFNEEAYVCISGQSWEADISTLVDETIPEEAENLALHELTHHRLVHQTKRT